MNYRRFGRILGSAVLVATTVFGFASCEGQPAANSAERFDVDVIIAEGEMSKVIQSYNGENLATGKTEITDYGIIVYRSGDSVPYIAETVFEKADSGYTGEAGSMYQEMSFTLNNMQAGSYDFVIRGYIDDASSDDPKDKALVAEDRYDGVKITKTNHAVGPFTLKTLAKDQNGHTVKGGEIHLNLQMPDTLVASAGSWNADVMFSIYEGTDITEGEPLLTVNAVLTGTDGEYGAEYTFKDGTDSYTQLEAGVYTLVATVTDTNDEDKAYSTVDVIRLFPGLPADGSLVFAGSDTSYEGSFSIKDQMGVEIQVPIGGQYKMEDGQDEFVLDLGAKMSDDMTAVIYCGNTAVTRTEAETGDDLQYVQTDGETTQFHIYNIADGVQVFTVVLVKEGTTMGVGSFSFTVSTTLGEPSVSIG